MNKTQLLKEVSKSTEIDIDTVRTVLNSIIKIIQHQLWLGIDIKIKDFITFKIEIRRERKVLLPKTKREIIVPKHYFPKATFPRTFKLKLKKKTVY